VSARGGQANACLIGLVTSFAAMMLLWGAPQAQASRGLTLGFSGGAGIFNGTSNISSSEWLGRARAVGAGIVRVAVDWSETAPTTRPAGFVASNPASPGYDWSTVDSQVESAEAHGLQVLLTITTAPTWAQDGTPPRGTMPGAWRPDPAQLGAFGTAVATRYDGRYPNPSDPLTSLPKVTDYQAWNEPNLSIYLSPQWLHKGHSFLPESPVLYRSMENQFYDAVKSVSPSNFVVLAGTAPFGDPPGGQRMPPVAFYRALFCLQGHEALKPVSCPSGVYLDAIDHHPYGVEGPTVHALNPDDAAVPDIDKLTRVLHAAERAGRALPRGPKQVWATEISWDSDPPDPGGVPLHTQARWLEQAFYVLWAQGVSTVMWLQIVDSPPIPNYASTYQDGLYYLNGTIKRPTFTAFVFPFVTQRVNANRISVWGRSPLSGELQVERQVGSQWQVVARLYAHVHQVFDLTIADTDEENFRAQVAGQTSLTWTQGR
jgi:hypothetical protein